MQNKTLYQTWHSNVIPTYMKLCMDHNKHVCPYLNFKLFDINQCEKYLSNNFDHSYVHTYRKLKPYAFKSDFWRLCILYKEGGIYMDCKLRIINPKEFLNLLNSNQEYLLKDKNEYKDFEYTDNNGIVKYHLGIQNQLIITNKNNPFLQTVIDNIMHNVKYNIYTHNCLHVTGPSLLGKLYEFNNFTNPILLEKSTWQNIVSEYPMCRKELKKFTPNVPNYFESWANRDIYNNI